MLEPRHERATCVQHELLDTIGFSWAVEGREILTPFGKCQQVAEV